MNSKQLNALEKRLAEYQGEDRIVSSLELAEMIDAKSPVPKVPSGIPTMDRLLDSLEPGELVILSGPTSGGKTTLMMTISSNLSKRDYKCAWFTLEVTPRQFIFRLMRSHETIPLFYMPAKNADNTVNWLIERIIEAVVKFDVKVIFIDHLHQILSIEHMAQRNLSLEIGDVVAKIKQIAIEYGLVIYLVAHNTDNKISPNAEPKMQEIRDSGMISRIADVVMGIWRVPNDPKKDQNNRTEEVGEFDNRAKVKIWKNRREGKVGAWFMFHENQLLIEKDNDGWTSSS